jgi:AraC-like DNA-binding protein
MKPFPDFLKLNFESMTDSLPFAIRTIEWMKEKRENERSINHRNNHYVMIWVTKGRGSCWIDLNNSVIENNHLLFIKPGQFHGLQLTDDLEGYVISFTESFLGMADHDSQSIYGHLYQMLSQTQEVMISDESVSDMKDITEIMLKEFINHNLYRTEILRRYFKIFLIYLSRQFEAPAEIQRQPRNTELLQNFMSLLEKNFRSKKMVADYADQLAVTPNYLNEVVKKITGYSAGHHIRQRVALEAKRQAAYSNICMKKIAYDLGFCDMAHFSKFFKNATGMNFSDFKKTGMAFQPVF